ncbi:MAG: histidine kinase [Flavobacteriales bacterium]
MLGIYYVQKDYDRALETARKAYIIFKKLEDNDNLGLTSHNLGTVFLELNMLDSAYLYAAESQEYYKKSQNPEGIADANRFMGDVKLRQNKISEALACALSSVETFKQIGGVHKLTETYLLLSAIYLKKGDYEIAIDYAKQVVSMAGEIGTRHLRRDAYKKLMECYEEKGDFKKYHEYSKLYLPLKDSILDEENLKAQKESVIRFETQQKETENAELKLKDQIQKEKIQKQNTYLTLAAIAILLILVIAYYVIRHNQTVAKSRTYKLEQELLRTQMNPHFIFNALSAIQSFVYKKEPKEAGKYLSSFAVLIRNILDHSRSDYITLVKEISWLENYLEVQKLRFENNFEYEITVDTELIPENTLIPPMLTQPFIENSLEHGFRDLTYMGKLAISFTKEDRSLVVEINDNGKGFTAESSSTHTPMGTSITRERIEILNKRSKLPIEFSISEKTSGGVVVKFKIPLEDI